MATGWIEQISSCLLYTSADVLEGKLGALGERIGRLLFKLSVDQNLMGNILAAGIEIDPDQLRKARVRCVKEVKETCLLYTSRCV